MEWLPKKQDNDVEKTEEINVEYAFHSIASEMHPHKNDDSILVDKDTGFAIFDGISEGGAGNIASETACKHITDNLHRIQNGINAEKAKDILEDIMYEADEEVYKKAKTKAEYENMGTTASVLKIHTDENKKYWALVANIGDSRIYKINKDGNVEQITTDDDYLDTLSLSKEYKKEISKKLSNVRNLKELDGIETICFENRWMVSNSLGGGIKPARILKPISIQKGDRFLITSDGIHDNLTTEEIKNIIKQSNNIQETIDKLMHESTIRSKKPRGKEARAKKDDMSAILISIK